MASYEATDKRKLRNPDWPDCQKIAHSCRGFCQFAPPRPLSNQPDAIVCFSLSMTCLMSKAPGRTAQLVLSETEREITGLTHPLSPEIKFGIPKVWCMREETVTVVRDSPVQGRRDVVRLTYSVSEGHRPDIVRWFLVREEVLTLQDTRSASTGGLIGVPSSA